MHTMNGVNVELTTRIGLVNDATGACTLLRRRGVPPPICSYVSCHVFIVYKYRLYLGNKSHLP
jgi:hypothetical protein